MTAERALEREFAAARARRWARWGSVPAVTRRHYLTILNHSHHLALLDEELAKLGKERMDDATGGWLIVHKLGLSR